MGSGGERIHVVGLRRISRDFVNCTVECGVLANIRTSSIYSPKTWRMLEYRKALQFESKSQAEELQMYVSSANAAWRADKLKPKSETGPCGDYSIDMYRKVE